MTYISLNSLPPFAQDTLSEPVLLLIPYEQSYQILVKGALTPQGYVIDKDDYEGAISRLYFN